jgi:hypothetical protein
MLPPLKSQTAVQVYDTNTIALPWPTGPAPRCLRVTITADPIGKRRYSARLPESAVTVLGCFGALERVVRTLANSPKRKETDGGIQRALPGWGPANRTAQIPKTQKRPRESESNSLGNHREEQSSSDVRRAVGGVAAGTGRWRRAWPAGSHTHTHTDQTWRWDQWWRLNGNAEENRPASSVPKESPAG